MEFQPIVATKLYRQVINQIKQMIYDKTVKKGDKLPSERDMAIQFGVSRTAIREALRCLEMLGLTESRQGGGTFIVSSFPEYNLFEPLSLVYTLEDNTVELIEVRSMLEIECAGMAALAITPQELKELKQYTDLLTGVREGTITEEADHVYHSLIAKASHNSLLHYMYLSVHEVVSQHIVSMRQMILEDHNNAQILARQHNDIYQAILQHDSKQARQEMREHMRFVHDQLCKNLTNK